MFGKFTNDKAACSITWGNFDCEEEPRWLYGNDV